MTYIGSRGPRGNLVRIHNDELHEDAGALPLRTDLKDHGCDVFDWGRDGGGAANLALAVLAHHLGDDEAALQLYQTFKAAVVVNLTGDSFWLDAAAVDRELAAIAAASGATD